jgi:Spy/CpxP family protein refolding chaperone
LAAVLITTKAIADQSTLMAQTSAPPTEQREEGSRQRRGSKFERLTGITDAQKTQLRQIHEASHQQIDAIPQPSKKPKCKQFARIPKLR